MDYALRARTVKHVNHFLSYVVLIAVAAIIVTPLFALLATSIKVDSEYNVWPIHIFPRIPQWINYLYVFTMTQYVSVGIRTAALGAAVTLITTLTSSMIGFAFARYPVKGSKQLFFLVIALMFIPAIVILIPQFVFYSRLKLTNTYWPWIFNAIMGGSFYIFLFRQYFMNFPSELEDAAEVDGAGPFRIYSQVFMPNAKPVIATVAIFAFSGIWGDYLMPLMLLNDDKTLLSVKLASAYKNPQGVTLTTISMAANAIYIIPLVVLFFLAQKQILRGVVMSGLKG